jgi:hypothetical protein
MVNQYDTDMLSDDKLKPLSPDRRRHGAESNSVPIAIAIIGMIYGPSPSTKHEDALDLTAESLKNGKMNKSLSMLGLFPRREYALVLRG